MSQSPFKFLDTYNKEDKDIFFGREVEVEDVYSKIFHGKILLVYGASGTGKSSLISCGLGNKFEDADWLPVNVRRGVNINDSLKQQLEKVMLTQLSTKTKVSLKKILKSVYLDHFKPIYLIFDQFEELFIFGDREEWSEFVNTVREVLDGDLQVKLVFIIRGEYLEYLTDFELTVPEIFSNRIRIEKMTRANAVNCITGPCKSSNIQVEDHFAENLLTKLSPSKTEIELTYLQVFLDRIYKKAKDKSNGQVIFSNNLLDELGNVGDVLSQFLDEQIELIHDSERALALLKAFVSTDATKKQITASEAAEFVKTIGQDFGDKQIDRLIQELVNRRILKDKDEADRYELRHDSIAAKIFEKITSYERDLIEVNQFITYAYGEHEKRNFLLNESDLAYIAPYETKLNFSGKLREFIEKSKSSVKKSKRGRKLIIAVALSFGALTIISLLALIYAFIQQVEAKENAKLAREQSMEAVTQKEAAEQQKNLANQQKTEADRQAKIAQEQSAIAFAQRQEADRQRQLANQLQIKAQAGEKYALEEKAKANAASLDAQRQAKIAEQNSIEALKAKEEATRFRMLAIAQAMGAKAVDLQDKDQKTLVAKQAYLFNMKYGGYLFESDIYNGLYSAYKEIKGAKFNKIVAHQGPVRGLVALGSRIYVTVGSDGRLIKTDWNISPPSVTEISKHPFIFQSMDVTDDNRIFAVGTAEGKILVFDAKTLKHTSTIQAHKGTVWTLAFDNNNNLFSAGEDKEIIQWDLITEKPTIKMTNSSAVNSIDFSSVQNTLAVGSATGLFLYKRNPTSFEAVDEYWSVRMLFSNWDPNFSYIANDRVSYEKAEYECIKDTKGGLPPSRDAVHWTKTNAGETWNVTSVKFFPTGVNFAAGNSRGEVAIISERGIDYLSGHQATVNDLQFKQNSDFLLSSSYDGKAMLWNLESINQKQVIFSDFSGWVMHGNFDSNGDDLIMADATGQLSLYPIRMEYFANNLCQNIREGMYPKEWENFVGADIPYTKTCPNK